jgi:protein-S-isoprenylcysteine O-methyltransferase Ste14
MIWFYRLFFPAVWAIFLLYWPIKARNTKAAQRLEPSASRILRLFLLLIALVLFSTDRVPLPWLQLQLWRTGFWPFWLGAVITVGGVLFAIWAREHLGRNWSDSVTIKQEHELITSGPYALVRHPIYIGILTGASWYRDCTVANPRFRSFHPCIFGSMVEAPNRRAVDALTIW